MKSLIISCLLLAMPAFAVSVKVEPGVAIPLTAPQSSVYKVGAGGSLKLLLPLGRYFDLGPSAEGLWLPATGSGASGTGWMVGGSLRLKRPHDSGNFSPWLDGDGFYVRTGQFNRPGLAAAVGVAVALNENRSVWLGPFVRYTHIFQPNPVGFDNRDSKTLTAGLSFEFGSGVDKDKSVVPSPSPTRYSPPSPPPVIRPPASSLQTTEEYVVLPRMGRVYFDLNQYNIKPIFHDVLDNVTRILTENKNIRVQVNGHSDSMGSEQYNQLLSERRAKEVVDYLSRGVARDRLTFKGFGSSQPLDTNRTSAGHASNRRVEFEVTP